MNFITENIGTIGVLLILALVISGIIFKLVKDKKQEKSSCGCGCENCPSAKYCHKDKQQ